MAASNFAFLYVDQLVSSEIETRIIRVKAVTVYNWSHGQPTTVKSNTSHATECPNDARHISPKHPSHHIIPFHVFT
jgi:hypothetical protein